MPATTYWTPESTKFDAIDVFSMLPISRPLERNLADGLCSFFNAIGQKSEVRIRLAVGDGIPNDPIIRGPDSILPYRTNAVANMVVDLPHGGRLDVVLTMGVFVQGDKPVKWDVECLCIARPHQISEQGGRLEKTLTRHTRVPGQVRETLFSIYNDGVNLIRENGVFAGSGDVQALVEKKVSLRDMWPLANMGKN